jgi:hypothetical protein
MDIHYLDALFTDSVENPNFFNGRILTAQDMQDAQRAARTRTLRLGQAVGEGVAHGLQVTTDGDKLIIGAGLAVNRCGQPLLLSTAATIPLTASSPATATMDSPFAPCDLDPALLVTSTINTEFLLLLLTSATRFATDQAASSGLNSAGGNDIRHECTSRYEQEGIQFKLAPLADYFTPTGNEERWQSLLANACFGTAALHATASAPFTVPARYGLVDTLRLQGMLTACDVPLAVLRWRNRTIRFVDQWAVRRPCYSLLDAALLTPSATGYEPFVQHATSRRAVEARTRLLQFQEQIEALRVGLAAPHSAAAVTHFTHLPAAGYLRLRSDVAGTAGKGFQIAAFFQGTFTPQPLDPAYLRSLFHDSFSVEPLPVPEGDTPLPVDLYLVDGTDPQQPYVVFVRRRPLLVVEPPVDEPPPVDDEPPVTPKTGDLLVAVTDAAGDLLTTREVAKITATPTTGRGPVITGKLVRSSTELVADLSLVAKDSYELFLRQFKPIKGDQVGRAPAIYLFAHLPEGTYTVAVAPVKSSKLSANSAIKKVTADLRNTLTIPLLGKHTRPPGGIKIPDDDRWVLPGGHLVDKVYVNPKWKELLDDPRHPPVPQPPDEWGTDPPPDLIERVKDIISEVIDTEPQIALTGSRLLVRPDYDPRQVYIDPYAYLNTADGTYFPVILVGGEHALAGDVAAVRSGISDLDTVAYNTSLRDSGLQNLEALTGAWSGLVNSALTLDTAGATSLIQETRAEAQRLQGTFARYPGIDQDASNRLKQSFTDDVALANASPEAVLAALGEGFTAGFASRLIDRAKNAVAPRSWMLDDLGLSLDERDRLADLGVHSKGDFVALGGSAAGRDRLLAVLGIDTAGLARLEESALAGVIGGRYRNESKAGVAGVRGVTDTMANRLVTAGIRTATDLATMERATLATLLDISVTEANELVVNATETSGTFDLLARNLGLSDENITALRNQGITSTGDLARADRATLGTALGDATLGDRLANVTGRIFGGR